MTRTPSATTDPRRWQYGHTNSADAGDIAAKAEAFSWTPTGAPCRSQYRLPERRASSHPAISHVAIPHYEHRPGSVIQRMKHAGRKGRRWERLKANLRMQHRPCCRCGQAIDYTLRFPHRDSFSVDHYPHPLSTHPHLAEDPANLDAAHLRCNQSAGDRIPRPSLGVTTRQW